MARPWVGFASKRRAISSRPLVSAAPSVADASRRVGFDASRPLLRSDDILQGRRIDQPSLFLVGERDPVRNYSRRHETEQAAWLTDLRGSIVLPGAGHWLQQERPDEVNRLLIDFLNGLTVSRSIA